MIANKGLHCVDPKKLLQTIRAAYTLSNSWPCGLMDKALVFGTKDCRFESCQGHFQKCSVFRSQLDLFLHHFDDGDLPEVKITIAAV